MAKSDGITEHDGPKPKINFGGGRPADPANGLLSIIDDLNANPGQRRRAVIEYDAGTVARVTDTGQQVPTIRIWQIEPVAPGSEVDAGLQRIMTECMSARGQQLDLDQSEQVDG